MRPMRKPLPKSGNENGARSVLRALAIVDLLGRAGEELGVTEISNRLGLHKSTVFRLLTTLAAAGYVRQESPLGKYRLGMRLAELGMIALSQIDLRSEARPFLRDLMEATGETVHLGIVDGDQVVYIDKIESRQILTMKSTIGSRAPAHCTALGKVLMAFLPDEDLDALLARRDLARLTANTIAQPAGLREHLVRIREQGYAIDDEEHEPGIRCIAAPIRDHTSRVVAAVSVSGPSVRITREAMERIIPRVIEAGNEISRAVGHNADPQVREERGSRVAYRSPQANRGRGVSGR